MYSITKELILSLINLYTSCNSLAFSHLNVQMGKVMNSKAINECIHSISIIPWKDVYSKWILFTILDKTHVDI